MGVLEEVTNMQNQGIDQATITNTLREKGVSPQEINDAFSQAQIKNAVAQEEIAPPTPQPGMKDVSQYKPQTMEVEDSQYSPPIKDIAPAKSDDYIPQTQEQYMPQEEYYPQESYQDYSGGTQTDTMIEIAEQVFFEKMQKLQKQVDDMEQYKTLSQTKLESVENRLKKIETIIDKLQISILDRVGSYARGLDSIKKEMNMIEDSFSKVISHAARNKSTVSAPRKPIVRKRTTKRKTKKK